jgi:hypothetical protein
MSTQPNAAPFMLLLAQAGRSFSPLAVPGLLVWLDASANKFQEITGAAATTPATADADPVGTWRAKTGQYFVAPSNAQRFTNRILSGKPYVNLPAAAGGMRGSPEIDLTGAVTVFAAGKPGTDGGGTRRTVQSSLVNAVLTITRRSDTNNFFLGATAISTTNPTGDPRSVAIVDPAAGNCSAYLNGIDVTTAGVARADWRQLRLGNDGNTAEQGDSFARHVLVYSRALTPAEMFALHTWSLAQ